MNQNAAPAPHLTVLAFSKDRPLQLHAMLSSLRSTCRDPERLRVQVIVYASDDATAARYVQVGRELPWAALIPEDGFKETVLRATAGAAWIAFVVDDALFVRPWSAGEAMAALERVPKAIGLSLRLGRNTTSCYSMNAPQPVPPVLEVGEGWLACDWTEATHDFAYPLELSSSIYRAADVRPLLQGLEYRNPNQLEAALAGEAPRFAAGRPALLLPSTSVAFCAPINVVQTTYRNRCGGRADQSIAALDRVFDQGLRVDVGALRGHTPPACHEELELPLHRPGPPAVAAGRGEAPAVSVVIPCYRQAEYLPFALASLAMQTFQDWEVIVVDDGSPDATSDVVRDAAAKLPGRRIRLLRQENAGLANARNAGFQAARGRYLLPLDADDGLEPTFLERTVAVLEAEPEIGVVHTDAGIFGARQGVWETPRPFDTRHLIEENGLPYASLFRREVWARTGGYRANMSAGYEDWDFWLGAAAAGYTARRIPEPLLLYREKSASMLTEARRHDAALGAQLRLNHPTHFAAPALDEARAVLAAQPLPPARPATSAREIPLDGTGSAVVAAPAPAPVPAAPPTARLALPDAPADPAASLEILRRAGAWRDGTPLRLHLGCGERHLDGYVNVDLAPATTSLMATCADVFGDVPRLRFPPGSVDEVRSHHMFEHFPRVEALALLIRWHEWLRPGGRLVVETPDLEGSARTLLSQEPLEVKLGVVRHLAGDQGERWAFHVDHWFPERFRHTLARLGFGEVRLEQRRWPQPPFLSDVIALGTKTEALSREDLIARAEELLAGSLVAPSERPLLARWRAQLREVLAGGPLHPTERAAPGPAAPLAPAAPAAPDALASWVAARGSRRPLEEIVDFNQRARDRWVAGRAASVPAGARVLDVGAGTCPYRPLFAHCDYVTHDFKRYDGVKLGGGTDYGAIDLVSEITAIPAPPSSFDVVLCTEVLEHVPRPREAVLEMARLLRPGGRLLLTAPLGSGLHQLPFHYYGGFSPEWYRQLAAEAGLEVTGITPNGGFFRLLAQESARAADLLASGPADRRPPAEVLRLLGEGLPRWFFALDDERPVDQFTVGYFVEARRAPTGA